MSNTAIPADIQSLVDDIRSKYNTGMTMSLGAPEGNPEGEPTPTPQVPAPADPDNVFTKAQLEDAIQKARQQEKDKLYGKVSTLEERLADVAKREEERQAAEEQARREAAEKARRDEEENLSAKELLARKEQEWAERLNTTQQSFEQQMAQLAQEREQERALLEKERSFTELQAYKTSRLAAETDSIAPQFHDFIQGNTQDEIEQSIAVAKAKSAEVAEQVQAALQAARASQRGTSISGYAPVGPMEFEGGQRQFSADEIAGMSMEEYAQKVRPHVVGGGATNRGLFG